MFLEKTLFAIFTLYGGEYGIALPACFTPHIPPLRGPVSGALESLSAPLCPPLFITSPPLFITVPLMLHDPSLHGFCNPPLGYAHSRYSGLQADGSGFEGRLGLCARTAIQTALQHG